jgi:hypothetical protein
MRRTLAACGMAGAMIAACSAARQQKPDLPAPEYEPARSLDIAPPPAPASAPLPPASASPEPDSESAH